MSQRLRPGTLIHELEDGLVQVGSHPNHSLLLSGLTPIELGWLRSLVTKKAKGPDLSERQNEILTLLDAAGLLTELTEPMRGLNLCVHGLDEVGIRVARLLAESQVRKLSVRGEGFVNASTEALFPPSLKGLPIEEATKALVRQICPTTATGKQPLPDVVVTCQARVLDHGILGMLLSQDTVHIPVVTDDRSITVGPLVLPGHTACGLCHELHVRDATPSWPKIRGSLGATEAIPAIPYMATIAAGLVVSLIDAVASLGAAAAATLTAALNKDDPGQPLPTQMVTPVYRISAHGVEASVCQPHPDCGCISVAA